MVKQKGVVALRSNLGRTGLDLLGLIAVVSPIRLGPVCHWSRAVNAQMRQPASRTKGVVSRKQRRHVRCRCRHFRSVSQRHTPYKLSSEAGRALLAGDGRELGAKR